MPYTIITPIEMIAKGAIAISVVTMGTCTRDSVLRRCAFHCTLARSELKVFWVFVDLEKTRSAIADNPP